MTLKVALELVRKAAVLELIAPWCAVRLAQPRFGNEKGSVDAGVPGGIVRSNFLRRNM